MAAPGDPDWRRAVLIGAERLHERLDRRLRQQAGGAAPPSTAVELEASLGPWARVFAGGDMDALRRRLAWDGVRLEAAAAALGEPESLAEADFRLDGQGGLDACWLDELSELAVLGCDLRRVDSGVPPGPRSEIPFAELWWPWVAAAARATWNGTVASELPAAARSALEVDLWRDLADLSGLAALEAFAPRRATGVGYDAFVDELLGEGLEDFYRTYPALLRRTGILLRTWRAGIGELADRLRNDRPALQAAFAPPAAPGQLASIVRLDADRHQGGRGVYRLEFASGWRVIYKPRSLDLEAAFARVAAWARAQGLASAPPAARVLGGPGYGWMECVQAAAPAEPGAITEVFRRAGALVAFAHALGAADLHAENIIATASGPVVVDWEMLLQPARAGGKDAGSLGSCLDSGLLTRPGADDDEAAYPGLEPVAPRRLTDRARRWRALGSDAIAVGPADLYAAARENTWTVAGVAATPARNAPALLAGFVEAYRFLAGHREALGALLAEFGAARTRVLARRSQEYAGLLGMLGLPRFQRGGQSAGYLIEASLRTFAPAAERPQLWPLAALERESLENLDLPRFDMAVDGRDWTLPAGERIPGYAVRSGLEMATARLGAMSDEDLAGQVAVLRDALACGPAARALHRETEPDTAPAGAPARCLEGGLALARELIAELHPRTPLASGLDTPRESDDGLAGRGLYEGEAGRALWLAAAGAAGGGPACLEALDSALASLARAVERWERGGAPAGTGAAGAGGLGALNGLGGVLWSLVWIGRLVPTAAARDGAGFDRAAGSGVAGKPLEIGRRVAALLTPERLAADRSFDLEGGAAGAILGLLALYETTGEGEWLERAMIAGRTLVTHQQPAAAGGAAWRGPRGAAAGPMLAGFAHGAAGIARALAALAGFSGEPQLLGAVEAAHAFERGVYDRQRNNWPVLNAAGRATTWMTAWCHGAPGVALGRAFEPPLLRDGRADAEIEAAIAATLAAGLGSDDHLCCGAAGRIGALDAVGRRLGRPEWVAAAARLGVDLLARGRERGFRLPPARDAARARRGLFRGLPGISLQLITLGAGLPAFAALPLPSESTDSTGSSQPSAAKPAAL